MQLTVQVVYFVGIAVETTRSGRDCPSEEVESSFLFDSYRDFAPWTNR